jgi:small ligand-binding sensory domain FIST
MTRQRVQRQPRIYQVLDSSASDFQAAGATANLNVGDFQWSGGLSVQDDLLAATEEALDSAMKSAKSSLFAPTVALIFVNSVYEASASKYSVIRDALEAKVPSVAHMVGCTTGGVIGTALDGIPQEIEARASISIVLANFGPDVSIETFYAETEEEVARAAADAASTASKPAADGEAVHLLLSTESFKPKLSNAVRQLSAAAGPQIFGGVASAVTTLHLPKVFVLGTCDDKEMKRSTGMVGMRLSGNIRGAATVARSTQTVGPVFEVLRGNAETGELASLKRYVPESGEEGLSDDEIQAQARWEAITSNTRAQNAANTLVSGLDGEQFTYEFRKDADAELAAISAQQKIEFGGDDGSQPLVQLDYTLQALSAELQDKLKRELLMAVVAATPEQLATSSPSPGAANVDGKQKQITGTGTGSSSLGTLSIDHLPGYCGQKPTGFEPLTGSITIPSVPVAQTDEKVFLQFCVRDDLAARADLVRARSSLGTLLSGPEALVPQVALLFGSMERGTRVFRFSSWESRQIREEIQEQCGKTALPVAGMYSNGAFSGQHSGSGAPVMESDAVWTILSRKHAAAGAGTDEKQGPAKSRGSSSSSSSSLSTDGAQDTDVDVMTAAQTEAYDDTNEIVIVEKRDPESSAPVRVASMDYLVASKVHSRTKTLSSSRHMCLLL